jgi:nonsense-mediated mRNA decay protein 3
MLRSSDSERIREGICPRCGGPAPGAVLCAACRAADFSWLCCDPRVTITVCPSCGARREAGVWTDFSASRDELTREAARRGLHVSPEVRDVSVELVIHERTVNRSFADCRVRGRLFGEPVEENCRVEILWEKEQCSRCSRMAGSYYEGIVQVRGEGRRPRPAEIRAAEQIARSIEEGLYSSGERLSFISEMEETRDGLDIIVGSQRAGKEIASAIVERLGGHVSTHPKLVGEKAGKRVYRITYAVRLSPYSRGDIVLVRGKYGEVMSGHGREIRYRDLAENIQRTTTERQVERVVGTIADSREYLVTFRQGRVIGLLDPATGKSTEYPLPPGMDLQAGSKVRVIHDGDRLILLGNA